MNDEILQDYEIELPEYPPLDEAEPEYPPPDDAQPEPPPSDEAEPESLPPDEEAAEVTAEGDDESQSEGEGLTPDELKEILKEWALELNDGELPLEGDAAAESFEAAETVDAAPDYTEYLETLTAPRPFLTTPFEEYTVSEGLLLLVLLSFVVSAIYSMIRRFV